MVSDYEKKRLENLKENQMILDKLGIKPIDMENSTKVNIKSVPVKREVKKATKALNYNINRPTLRSQVKKENKPIQDVLSDISLLNYPNDIEEKVIKPR